MSERKTCKAFQFAALVIFSVIFQRITKFRYALGDRKIASEPKVSTTGLYLFWQRGHCATEVGIASREVKILFPLEPAKY
jgi:hypothetical protein